MKHIIYILTIMLFSSIVSFGQVPNWVWAKNAGGSSNEMDYSVASDKFANVYVTGLFTSPSITFGAITLINNSTAGDYDIYLVKYDSSGNVLWARSAGGIYYDAGYSVCTDISGNVYITGFFQGLIIFGTDTLTGSGPDNVFLAKYSCTGNILWARTAIGSGWQRSLGVSSDISGNVYITGYFGNANLTFGTFTLTNGGHSNVFLAKYDPNGNVLWAKSATANGYYDDTGTSVCADKEGNVCITGYFNSPTIIFDTDTLTNTNNLGYDDIFLVKYNNEGNVLWAKSAGGIDYDQSFGVSTDALGNVFITGYIGFPNATFDTITVSNNGGFDIFIAKYDNSGNALWAKNYGSINNDEGLSITTDNHGNELITGMINNSELFVNKYDNSGNLLWSKSPSGYSFGLGITTDLSDNAYITGMFLDATYTLGSTTLINNGAYDMFLAKLNSETIIGINDFTIDNTNLFTAFPNPTNHNFTLIVPPDTRQIQIVNSLGQIMQRKIIDKQTDLKFSLTDNGIYFIQVMTNKETLTKKLIVTN